MPDWMEEAFETSLPVSWSTLLLRLVLALAAGFVVKFIYTQTRHRDGSVGTFPTTLVLVCVLIAMVTQVIGDNVARAFSLVGALSIVRFRTVVRDTKDTAFVIFAVIVGMAVGAGQPVVGMCGILVVGFGAWILSDRNQSFVAQQRETLLTIRLSWTQSLEASIVELIEQHASQIETVSVETVRQGAQMDLTYRVQLIPNVRLTDFVAAMNRIEGVHTVELRTQMPKD